MSKSAPLSETDPSADASLAAAETRLLATSIARLERRVRRLDELAQSALRQARGLATTAATADPGGESTSPGAAEQFVRLARIVRLASLRGARADEALRALQTRKPAAGEHDAPPFRNYVRPTSERLQ